MVTIRSFSREDAPFLQQNLYPDMSLSDISELIDAWNTRVYNGKYFEMFAVLSDETVVGSVSLYERSKHIASLGAEIIPEARGKGAASSAISLLMQYAAEKGYRVFLDQVRADNAASIRLHQKLGFESDAYVYKNQRGRDVVLYVKTIES